VVGEEIRMVIEVSVPKEWLDTVRGLANIPDTVSDEELGSAAVDAMVHRPDLNLADLAYIEAVLER